MNSQDLRDHLAKALSGIQDGTMDLEKAKTIGELSQVAINLAKVEVDFVRANGGGRSDFFEGGKQITQTPTGLKIVNGNVTTHTLK
jgi:hypothetical protein